MVNVRKASKTVNAMRVIIWNDRHPPGTPVTVTLDNGDKLATKTRSEAWLLGAHAVVMVEGIAGGYLLDRVALREETR